MNQPVLLFLLSELDRVTGAIREHVTGVDTGLTLDDGQVDRLLKTAYRVTPSVATLGPITGRKPRSDKGKPRKKLAVTVNRLKRDYGKPRSDKGKPRNPPPAPKKRGRPPKNTQPAAKRGWPKGKKRGPRVTASGRKVARSRAFVFGKGYTPKKPADIPAIVAQARLVRAKPHADPKIHDITPQEARAV